MTWSKLDDGILDHPKIAALGPLGFAWFVAGLVYANRNLTDGFIPYGTARGLLPTVHVSPDGQIFEAALVSGMPGWSGPELVERLIAALVEGGVWEEIPGGYLIHDFNDWNPTRDEVLALREARARAGQAGGQASAQAKAKQRGSKRSSKPGSKTEANFNPVPVPEPEPEPSPKPEPGPSESKGADAPNPKAPNDIEAAMLDRLHQIDGWESLTFGAIVGLNGTYGRPVVTMALQRAREENRSPNGSAYGLIEAMCKDISGKAAASG